MDLQSPRRLVDRFIRALESGDADAAVATFAPDALYREAGAGALIGVAAWGERFRRFAGAANAWRFEIDELLENETIAAFRYRFVADAGGSSERRREREGCAFVRTDGKHIIEWKEYAA